MGRGTEVLAAVRTVGGRFTPPTTFMHPGPGVKRHLQAGADGLAAGEIQRSCSPDSACDFSKRAAIPASSCPSGRRVAVTCTLPDINMGIQVPAGLSTLIGSGPQRVPERAALSPVGPRPRGLMPVDEHGIDHGERLRTAQYMAGCWTLPRTLYLNLSRATSCWGPEPEQIAMAMGTRLASCRTAQAACCVGGGAPARKNRSPHDGGLDSRPCFPNLVSPHTSGSPIPNSQLHPAL